MLILHKFIAVWQKMLTQIRATSYFWL